MVWWQYQYFLFGDDLALVDSIGIIVIWHGIERLKKLIMLKCLKQRFRMKSWEYYNPAQAQRDLKAHCSISFFFCPMPGNLLYPSDQRVLLVLNKVIWSLKEILLLPKLTLQIRFSKGYRIRASLCWFRWQGVKRVLFRSWEYNSFWAGSSAGSVMFSKMGSNGSHYLGWAGSQWGPVLCISSAIHQLRKMNAQEGQLFYNRLWSVKRGRWGSQWEQNGKDDLWCNSF